MKKMSLILLIIFTSLLVISVASLMAQVGPPDPPIAGPEVGKYVATPIGGGVLVLLSMVGYGIYRLRKND
ncbi:MAG: hypothetical protein B6244_02990 [Candidatus Cloacimonetes bacterium 4572_55]|nr:MAG: hypothetical protein B6244_02990 [Candidatus Cloacimonetes bacterium 4572_55]